MIIALLSDFDRLTPAQRATVDHWIIDDDERAPPPTIAAQDQWDNDNEEIGR